MGLSDSVAKEGLPQAGRHNIVGFFPGLGSRAAYQNLGRFLLDSGMPEVAGIYEDGARALGFPGRPERLLTAPENMPEGKLAQQGFIGAAFLVHNLALHAYLRATAARAGLPLTFSAYTGESFGVLASAVASGSLSVADGVRIARAFTPLMLVAAQGEGSAEPLARELAAYLPDTARGGALVPEPSHVVALKGGPEDLAALLAAVGSTYPTTDVEVHKLYSPRQVNVYVRLGAKTRFDLFMKDFPAIETEELKAPTTFLAHSERMLSVRRALARFIEENVIIFKNPHTPVVSNNDAGLLAVGSDIRNAVLAMTDEVMASRTTAEILKSLDADMILELGLGKKSLQLLADNNVEAPSMSYTGEFTETDLLLGSVQLMNGLTREMDRLREEGGTLAQQHYDTLRSLLRMAAKSPFFEKYLYRTMSRVITREMLQSERDGSPAFHRFLEVFQHTFNHRDAVDVDRGELVLQARLKKRIDGDPDTLGQAYTELKVLDVEGRVSERASTDVKQPEVVVLHFARPSGPGQEDLAREARLLLDTHAPASGILDRLPGGPPGEGTAESGIAYQYTLFQLLRKHRPAVFAQSDYFVEGADPTGWLVALAAAEAVPLADAMALAGAYERAGAGSQEARAALERFLTSLRKSEVPVISPEGIPLQSRKDLEAGTRAVFTDDALDTPVRRIHLNGHTQILSLGSPLDPAGVDTGPYRKDVISLLVPAEIRERRAHPGLDAFEDRSVLSLTPENEKVLRYAQGRRLLRSTVYSYIHAGEQIVGFGAGGSESMTIFIKREGDEEVTVRKILSEALTTANWNPEGEGVMLPPFAKARKQAEYLQALPDSVRRNFPEVGEILERDIPVPEHLRKDGRATDREVIYEMSYVKGEEVSRFVEKHSPPPAVIARLYEEIFKVLNEEVHSVNRVPAPGETVDVSYFQKIEDRLALSRRTAPVTFGPQLLDTPQIVINGVSYLNHTALLERFREHPEYLEVLEPRFHSLVMGDTNTENIKMADPEPLLRAQRLIEEGAPQTWIDAALEAVTAESLGIKFLDPRSIGFKTDGRDTRDDPMYDNKPWHNSVGHYDEIHFERFNLRVLTGEDTTPHVDIEFHEGNPYQKAYQVRDVTAAGAEVDTTAAPRGMEDHFAPVMTAAYGLDDPESPYVKDDPYWLIRFVFMMGSHFTAMPPFHFQAELDGTLTDTYQTQRRPVAIYCEGIKWLNWALEMLEGDRDEFLGLTVPPLPYVTRGHALISLRFGDAGRGRLRSTAAA
ncbi:ACP S-malonyltransferase [Streptomyces sp. NBC_00249]|uniref:ACP S-malonyltransferase n=1 Tax=Streptomyces sp. NBC_00249 TaxID=2975690 RepID=UPI00225677F6|nr:ACP S-malonyltransferase [Streptomyces sp. NBC_00249]MCX5193079.1 ACP S-malonyltransferase [Streptomyces sp. NBC_00249]